MAAWKDLKGSECNLDSPSRKDCGLLDLNCVLPVTLNRYPTTQQYNDVVNALLQAHPFLDEDGCGFVSDRLAPFCNSLPILKQ